MANTITQVKRLVGLKFEDEAVKAELETHANFNAVAMPDGDVGFEVSYCGEDITVSSTQVLASLLTKCRQVVLLNNPGTKTVDMVISVPPFFTDAQRRAVKDAAHIAEVNCLRVLNEGTAAALSYGIFKGAKKEFPEGKETLCLFLDAGHASFTATAAKFTNSSLEVVASVSDSDLGSRDLDVAIAKHFAAEFKAKYGSDAWKSKKARVKLMVAAEKAKISISPYGVNSTPISIECLMEDRDYNGVLTTEKLEELVGADVTARVGSVIERVLRQTGCRDAADFAAVELVGGGMRPRLIKRAAAVALKLPIDEANSHGLSQSMNLDECVARGCALCCASLSPVFKVKPFTITDVVSYPVTLSWDPAAASAPAADEEDAAEGGPAAGDSSTVIFKTGDHVKARTVTIGSRKAAPFSVTLEYAPGPEHARMFPAGSSTKLGKYTVSGFPADLEEGKPRLVVKYDFDGLVSVTQAEVLREIKDAPEAVAAEAAAAAASAAASAAAAAGAAGAAAAATEASTAAGGADAAGADGEAPPALDGGDVPAAEKKKSRRYKKVDIKVELEAGAAAGVKGSRGVQPGAGMSAEALLLAKEAETAQCQKDADIRATQDTRNQLEAFIYSCRSALEDSLKAYGGESERAGVNESLGAAETWLYGEGFESDSKTYRARLKELEAKVAPLQGRKWEGENRRPAGEALMASVEEVRAAAANRTNRHGHLPESDRDILRATADKAEAWWNGVKAEQANRELFQDPVVKVTDISAKREQLLREATPIMSQKAPAAAPAAAAAAAAAPAAAPAGSEAPVAMDEAADAAAAAAPASDMPVDA